MIGDCLDEYIVVIHPITLFRNHFSELTSLKAFVFRHRINLSN